MRRGHFSFTGELMAAYPDWVNNKRRLAPLDEAIVELDARLQIAAKKWYLADVFIIIYFARAKLDETAQ